jgi:hypothetical protein
MVLPLFDAEKLAGVVGGEHVPGKVNVTAFE